MSNIFENKGAMAATIVVAASDSLNQGAANYVCDGAADDVEINAAITAVEAIGGGKVILLEGQYNIVNPIIIIGDVTLEGQNSPFYTPVGRATSIVNGGAGDAIQLTGNHDFTPSVKRMMISGSGATGNGITITKASRFVCEDLVIDDVGGIGIQALGCWIGQIYYCEIRHNGNYGIDLTLSGADYCTAIKIDHCHLGANTTADLHIAGASASFVTYSHFEHYSGSTEEFITGTPALIDIEECIFSSSNAGTNLITLDGGITNIHKCSFGGTHNRSIWGNSSYHVEGCRFLDVGDIAIYANGPQLQIIGNYFTLVTARAMYLYTTAAIIGTTVSNNIVIVTGTGTADDAIQVVRNYAVVSDNFVSGARGVGLRFTGCSYLTVVGNNIINSATDNIRTESTYSVYAGNTLVGAAASWAIFTAAPAAHNIIIGNVFYNNVATVYSVSGTDIIHRQHCDIFMDVLAVSANHVVNAQALGADPTVCALAAQPDVPRTLSWAITHPTLTAFTLTIVGVNANGKTVTEVYNEPTWAGETNNAFATVTSITMSAMTGNTGADSIDVGITDVLGLSNDIDYATDIYKIKKNNANAVVNPAQGNATYNTYDMVAIGLAVGDDFTIWYRTNLNKVG